MNIQSKKIRKSSFFQKSLFSHLQKWDFYKSFILACVWSAKKYFKTHHGQIRWTILSNTPLSDFSTVSTEQLQSQIWGRKLQEQVSGI